MDKYDELNTNVSTAIRKVEDAQAELAHAELAIARVTSPNSVEGRISRRCAVRAAREAGLDDLMMDLLKTFLTEQDISEELSDELRRIACEFRDK